MNLSDLRTLARQKADEPSDAFIGNSEINSYINQGAKYIYNQIVQTHQKLFIVEGTALNGGLFNLVSGTESYALPSDLKKLVTIEQRQAGSTSANDFYPVRLRPRNNRQLDPFYPYPSNGKLYDFSYDVIGSRLYFRPVPTDSTEIRLFYVPEMTILSLDTDVPVYSVDFHELTAEYGSIQCLSKSGEAIFKERFDVWLQDLQNMLRSIESRNEDPASMTITDPDSEDTFGISRADF